MGAERVAEVGAERVEVETATLITETPDDAVLNKFLRNKSSDPKPTEYEVTAPACFDNAAHVLQQANSGDDIDYRRVAVAMEWRLLGEAAHRRDVQRHESGLR